jgi:hypothetical protein
VTPTLPNKLQGQLPSADQIASLLAGIDPAYYTLLVADAAYSY